FGDANALIRKEVFEKVGGFTEDYGLGHEDWEFFAKISLQGYKLQIVPEPLFWYRVANSGMLLSGNKSKNNYRSFRPFMDENV
ncbi:glycosyltransferase family 2 protein, partial [Klebsiella pneumoniae]